MPDPFCRGSVIGTHDPDRTGHCRWCRQRVERPVPMPDRLPRSELTEAYAYHYDPDWGSGRE